MNHHLQATILLFSHARCPPSIIVNFLFFYVSQWGNGACRVANQILCRFNPLCHHFVFTNSKKREFILVHRGVNIYICNYQGRTSFLLFESLSFNNTIIRMVSVKVEGTYNLSFSYSFPSVSLEFEHCNINLVVSESSLYFSFRILMSCLMEKIQYPNRNSVKCCMMLLFIIP